MTLLAVSCLVIAVGYLVIQTTGETIAESEDKSGIIEVTNKQAERIDRILTESKDRPPLATTSRGTVIDVSANQITVDADGVESTWPLASDVEIWKDRESMKVDDLEAGDVVDVDIQQLGSRSNGWINTVVLVNVAASEETEKDDNNQASVESQTVSGEIVKIQDGVIVVMDDEGRKSRLPLSSSAIVSDNSTPISIDDLSQGTAVTLKTSQQGSVADGWMSVVDEIKVGSN